LTLPKSIPLWLALSCVLCPVLAQQGKTKGSNPVLGRISYASTYLVDASGSTSQHICFEVQRNGRYRISRLNKGVEANLQGQLSLAQQESFSSMLEGLDFTSRTGGVVRRGSEAFIAEFMQGEKTVHLLWLDPDHERPFPQSADTLIRWLQAFRAEGAREVRVPEFSANPICPRATDNPLQPLAVSQDADL